MRRLLLVALLVAGCGGQESNDVFERAQASLPRITSGTIDVHLSVHAFVPVERSDEVHADEVPLGRLRLTRWAKHPRRIACAKGLDCARAEVDVDAALRDLEPVLPSLPLDPGSIRSAEVDVAIAKRDDRPRWLKLRGELDPGLVPGTVPFEVELDLPGPS
jgi:hypothetical protein